MNSDSFNPNITGMQQSEMHRQAEARRRAEEQRGLTKAQRIAAFFGNSHTRILAGSALLMMSVFLLLSFISFFTAGAADQSMVQANGVIENARNVSMLHNLGGALGAAWSQFLIADGVGIAAFVLVVWCFTIGMRLLRRNARIHLYSYTLVSLFSMFTLSLVTGAATLDAKFAFFHLGGSLGYYANKALMNLAGLPGMIAANMIVVMLWILTCYQTLNGLYQRTRRVYRERRKRFNGEEISESDASAELSPFIGEQQVAHAEPIAPEPALPRPEPQAAGHTPDASDNSDKPDGNSGSDIPEN